jgi:hypothetical protein
MIPKNGLCPDYTPCIVAPCHLCLPDSAFKDEGAYCLFAEARQAALSSTTQNISPRMG